MPGVNPEPSSECEGFREVSDEESRKLLEERFRVMNEVMLDLNDIERQKPDMAAIKKNLLDEARGIARQIESDSNSQ